MTGAVLTTARLVLRRARMDDLETFFDIFSRPEAMAFWSTPPHTSREQTRVWLESMTRAPNDFVVEFEGRAVGKAGCWSPPWVGFILHPDVWGRGVGREAMAAVIGHMFGVCGADLLKADVDPRNLRSLALLEHLGFERSGYEMGAWTVAGQPADSVFLTLKAPHST